jgi:triphosphatase
LTPAVLSKAERAAELLSGAPLPVRSTSPALAPDMPTEEAIGALFWNCLSQFLGNLPVLGLVYRLSPAAEFDALRAESKRIGTLLGQARDWNVFVQTIRDGPLSGFADAPGFGKFIGAAQSRAEAAHGAVTQLANDRTAARFALRLDRFVALRGWRGDAREPRPDWLSEPVVDFAIKSLNRLHASCCGAEKQSGAKVPAERHTLRIAPKHMRYAAEFFGGLFHPHSAAERYIDKAQALQDLLGQRNDATIALGLVKTLDFGADAEFAYVASVAAGWCARSGGGDEPAPRKAWRSLRNEEPFWREAHANVEGA